jgi:hypothetical protein
MLNSSKAGTVMEPSEEIKNLLQEMRDTHKEHLALYKEYAQRSLHMQEAGMRRWQRAVGVQRIALILVFVGLIGLACLMVYLFSFFGFFFVH